MHWAARSHAVHAATDELYKRLDELMDEFVEVAWSAGSRSALLLQPPAMPPPASAGDEGAHVSAFMLELKRRLAGSRAIAQVCKRLPEAATLLDEMKLAFDKAAYLARMTGGGAPATSSRLRV